MRKFWFCFLVLLAILSCDDGDIITVELDFGGELERCDNDVNSYLMFDELEDPIEALILIFPRTTATDTLFRTAIPADNPVIFNVDDSQVRFIYRTYNAEPTFCSVIDENVGIVTSDNSAPSGTVEVSTVIEDFDNDGIPSELEDVNGNGDLTDDDTDGDGVPNYLDEDDDNDNVLTIDEDPDPDGDGDLSDARNTDGEGLPDYLEPDDDGDGIPTRLEDENGDMDPLLDFDLESENPNIPRFRNAESVDSYEDPGSISTSYTRQYTTTFIVNDIDLGVIRFDRKTYGSFVDSETIQNE